MNPILLDLGFFQLRYYGLMYVIALFLGLYLAKKDLKKASIHYSTTEFENIALFSFLFGILGGRLYYVVFNWQYYFSSGLPWFTPFAVWQGGLALRIFLDWFHKILPAYFLIFLNLNKGVLFF